MSDDVGIYQRVARGAVIVFAGNVIGLGLAFLTRVVAARWLTVDGYGYLILGVTILNTVALIAQLGLRQGIARNIPIADDKQSVYVSGMQIAVLIGAMSATIIVLLSAPISEFFLGSEFTPILMIFGLGVPFLVALNVTTGAFQGVEDAVAKALVRNVLYRGWIIVLVVVAIATGFDAVGAARGWVLGVGLTAVLAPVLLYYRTDLLPETGRWFRIDPTTTKELVAFSLPLMLAMSIWQLMHHTDNLFVGYFLEGADVGVYDVSFTLSRFLPIFLWAFAFIFLPAFSKLYSNDDRSDMAELYRRTTRWAILATLPLYLYLVSFSTFFLDVIFGAEYAESGYLILVLASAFFVHVLAGPNREALVAVGRTKFILWMNVLALVFNLGLNVSLIPRFGILGAAVATTTAYTLLNVALNYRLYTEWRIVSVSSSLAILFVAVVSLYYAAHLVFASLYDATLPYVLAFLAFFSLVYVGLVLVLPGGIRREELDGARRLLFG